MQRILKSLYLMPKRYTYFHVLFFMLKGSNMLCCKTLTMKDLGKNTIKPRITNVILYINTHNNCEKKSFFLYNRIIKIDDCCTPNCPTAHVMHQYIFVR